MNEIVKRVKQFERMGWRTLAIQDRPYLEGRVPVRKVPCFGLQPGDIVTSIGKLTKNGKESSSCRYAEYSGKGITYRGKINVDGTDWMVMEFAPEDITRTDGKPYTGRLFQLFIPIVAEEGNFLIVPLLDFQSTLMYHAVFNQKQIRNDKDVRNQ